MKELRYKEYTPEENEIYNAAIARIREEIAGGRTFPEACRCIDVADEAFRGFIVDDALKILVAELYYGKGTPLPELARALDVPLPVLAAAMREMLEDVEISAVEAFRQTHPDSPFGNA